MIPPQEVTILSPPCTEFSSLQSLNRSIHGDKYCAEQNELKKEAVKHVQFCINIAKLQIKKHKWLVFEHPAHAGTWHEDCMKQLLGLLSVEGSIADQCQYGFMTKIKEGIELPAMKPTRFVSNGCCILEELSRRCPKLHVHEPLMGGKAAAAAQHPPDLCRAMCRGLVRQRQYEKDQLAA